MNGRKYVVSVPCVLLVLFLLGVGAAHAQLTVRWNFQDFGASAEGLKEVKITPLSVPAINQSTNIVSRSVRKFPTSALGYLTVSNIYVPSSGTNGSSYLLELTGKDGTITSFTNTFPAGLSGFVNGADYFSASVALPGGTGYTQDAADAKFFAKAGGTMTGAMTNNSGIYGNAVGLTNATVTSVTRIISPVRPTNGDTNWHGPWEGTTGGFMEAIYSVNWPTNATASNAIGMTIIVKDGQYYPTNIIYLSNDFWQNIDIAGAGMTSTRIEGLDTNVFRTVGLHTATPLPIRGRYRFHGMTIYPRTNIRTAALYMQQYAQFEAYNNYFSCRDYLTNAIWGPQTASLTELTPLTSAPGVVGIYVSGNEAETLIHNNYFQGLAAAMWSQAAHPKFYDNICTHISVRNISNNNVWTNQWVNGAGAVPVYFGAAAIFDNPQYEAFFEGNTVDFSGYGAAFLGGNSGYNTRTRISRNYVEANLTTRYITDDLFALNFIDEQLLQVPDFVTYADPPNFTPPFGIVTNGSRAPVIVQAFPSFYSSTNASIGGSGWNASNPKWGVGGFDFTDPDTGIHASLQVLGNNTVKIAGHGTVKSNLTWGGTGTGNGAGITNVGGVKMYVALLNQSSSSPPTATVLKNELPGTFTFGYLGGGSYSLTNSAAAFTTGKTWFSSILFATGPGSKVGVTRHSTSVLLFSVDANEDDVLVDTPFEIRIYP